MTRSEQEKGKGAAAGNVGSSSGSPAGGNDPFGMAEWLKGMPSVPLHPLMQHPAAAMAAATAIGLGMTSQFAGFMLGAMQGVAQTAQKAGAAERAVTEADEPVAVASAVAEKTPATETVAAAEVVPVMKAPAGVAPIVQKPVAEKPVARAPAKAERLKRQKAAARIVETPPDDLKRISGIGPKLEQVLNGMGIRRYADVAMWTDKDVQRFDDQLGVGGRIVRDGWVEQAKALMKG